jgi:hypothetical protein
MKRTSLALILVVLLVSVLPVFAQDEDVPPQIAAVTWEIARNQGLDPFWGPFEPFVPFDPDTDLAREGDLILLTVDIIDDGLPESADGSIFIRKQSEWFPYDSYFAPEPPPVDGDTRNFIAPRYTAIGVGTATCTILFSVPEWNGTNQARLRGLIDWDVRWLVSVEVCSEEEPGEDTPISSAFFFLYAVENTAFRPADPPSFADAGADQVVLAGVQVLLDGSRTFDNFNVGFDLNDENVFEKDDLTFTWEWLSGPVRVDPVQTDPHDAIATVTLVVPNDPDDPDDFYEYRLLVDDNVNALPSADSVRIFVRDSLDTPHPPQAIIEGPANPQPIGTVITLVSRSTDPDDPDGSELEYRWQQTDALGGVLDAETLRDVFQPLSGMTEPTLTWQALRTGTFYFRLLVDDGYFRSSARFSVEVIATATSGASETADTGSGDEGASAGQDGGTTGVGPELCGAGALPLAALPLALCLVRRRIR